MDEAQSLVDNSSLIRCAHRAQVDPKMLRPHPGNPNFHSEEQINLFVQILRYTGWRRPITISTRSNFITKGHGAREASLAAGCSIVPVDYQDYESEAQEIADIIADNQLARMSQMSNIKLQDLIVSLDDGAFNLELTGLPMARIETLMTTVPGWSGPSDQQTAPTSDLSIQNYATETIHAGGPAHGEPHIEHWQSDIDKSKKIVDDVDPNTDGIVATIKISCPQPLADAVRAILRELIESYAAEWPGVALA